MKELKLSAVNAPLQGELEVPGDKSISHRSVIFGALAHGVTTVSHFLDGEDCMRTVDIFRAMGVSIDKEGSQLKIVGKGRQALTEPTAPLYFGNSGTTARLMLGILAGLPFFTTVYGDASLTKRPMNRVVDPLCQMGAHIDGRKDGNYLPLAINGDTLSGIHYHLPVKSAQVKSAVLLAGLYANGETTVVETSLTRNHTETMLQAFGADIEIEGKEITVKGNQTLSANDVYVPGDISSAAFFLAAAAIVQGSSIRLLHVGLNETRTGIIDVLKAMGANVIVEEVHSKGGELLGNIRIAQSPLIGTTIEGEMIPRLIDEIPIIALLATQAVGTTVIKDAEELRVKETDRILAVTEVLTRLGADVEATDDGLIVHGKTPLTGNEVASYHDHRIAMMASVASLITNGEVIIDDISPVATSYPNFYKDLDHLIK
ncbi:MULTISPECIES: 3-phosphoshikimate 1-carboxyvinyltransferase [Virgibacillus]|uniref:3-phosphoshikimate 1-carboxyvinyltransferase n=2 Tax=Virgibacillus TaxID=84406 RepID=A0A024QC02_9BACI|nr:MULTISPECIES: 3-phosphoshikimate 1-carboxyvinyltransferase [Virgibacillus]EQB36116.1 hypothetical protein M948_13855 [Virgibacillus sp. CM-4]MYL41982.1 3-phosphoshikimate 1-carboxyvinyltransferase [Virgibacillus massiliensis]GGJ46566.1 3-phosphoshikimate 1-carboxyvinyltransferase [Virgibacillus kapii]CDQ39812.1 3-phosphoshikimate 1-carboxyvinyltransferase 1 [Virgibacillus massiliensis]